jgi:hypothetical protein
MPTRMRGPMTVAELRPATLSPPLAFTKGCPVLKIPVKAKDIKHPVTGPNALFDLQNDPKEERPLSDPAIERSMIEKLVQGMRDCDAPAEQFARLGLDA